MIILQKQDLYDQAGMERAFRSYFVDVAQDCDGTFNAMLGMRLHTCDHARRSVTLAMDTQPWMANPSGILHGGITASVLDLTMGLLARYCTGGRMTPTISMETSYLSPIPLGKTILVEATVTRPGYTICHTIGEIRVQGKETTPAATGVGTYYVSKKMGESPHTGVNNPT